MSAETREGFERGGIMNQVLVLVEGGMVSEVSDFDGEVSSVVTDSDNRQAEGVVAYVLRLDGERILSMDEADWFGLAEACFDSVFDAVKAAEVLVKSGRVARVDLEARGEGGEVVSVSALWSRLEAV
jgi:hypothetical protein